MCRHYALRHEPQLPTTHQSSHWTGCSLFTGCAVQLNGVTKLAVGHTAIGYTKLPFDWNADAACKEFDEAIALNPAWVDAHHWHSHALWAAERFPESLTACRRIQYAVSAASRHGLGLDE